MTSRRTIPIVVKRKPACRNLPRPDLGSLKVFGYRVNFIIAREARNTTGQGVGGNQPSCYSNRQFRQYVQSH